MTQLSAFIDISPEELEIVQTILKKHLPNHGVWAFGSRVQHRAYLHSDLDLAIIGNLPIPIPLNVLADLKDDFSESDLPWHVDLIDWTTTSDQFRAIIEKQKVVIQ